MSWAEVLQSASLAFPKIERHLLRVHDELIHFATELDLGRLRAFLRFVLAGAGRRVEAGESALELLDLEADIVQRRALGLVLAIERARAS